MSRSKELSDVRSIRARARRHIERGAVTESYGADREVVLRLLNEALATEIVCTLRYKRHYFMASGLNADAAAAEFLEHALQETEHADRIAERIVQLGGEPDFSPDDLAGRSHAEYVAGRDLAEMLREDLVAERIAVESYSEMIRFIGDGDSTTRTLLESILAVEEKHAEDLASLLSDFAPPKEPVAPKKRAAPRRR
ncbi:MAG: bacterioferritin [Planctomycetes bacterium]|nr:bacterioferritin [Planctomycetota bacterium]